MLAEVATKSLRCAVSMIAEHGADSVIVFVEGKLSPGNILEGAGLVTRQKTADAQPKPIRREATETRLHLEA